MKRRDRAAQTVETHYLTAWCLASYPKTREEIKYARDKWARHYGLRDTSWTNDGEIIGFIGHSPSGDLYIYYMSQVQTRSGLKMVDISRIVTAFEFNNIHPEVSPYLFHSAEAYKKIQQTVRELKSL